MSTGNFSHKAALLILLMMLVFVYACTRVEDTTRSASLLIIDSVEGVAGALGGGGGTTGVPLFSDVLTCNEDHSKCEVVNDNATVTFRNQFMQVGAGTGLPPTYLNDIVVTQYRVDYFRPNGRNVPGVDVPYGIDGTMTVNVTRNTTTDGSITVVRHEAKKEPPLHELLTDGTEGVITANAAMKFYGHDIAGRTVSATGYLEIHFADFGP